MWLVSDVMRVRILFLLHLPWEGTTTSPLMCRVRPLHFWVQFYAAKKQGVLLAHLTLTSIPCRDEAPKQTSSWFFWLISGFSQLQIPSHPLSRDPLMDPGCRASCWQIPKCHPTFIKPSDKMLIKPLGYLYAMNPWARYQAPLNFISKGEIV